jgi:outer membrane receptor for ferrienterochelin and colicins
MKIKLCKLPKVKMKKYILILTGIMLIAGFSEAKKRHITDANIIGHVTCGEEHMPFASVFLKGTTIGTRTNVTGHYQLINLPEGKFILRAQCLGCKPQEIEVIIKKGETQEVKFELEEDILGLEEVVVTGNRNEINRKESSVIVNSLTKAEFASTQSLTLGEGLNFCPGLRLENNCQNCGFTQIRMNGMEGPYSQILINSRPIFSGLAGVYGLELIPTNMIERIEIVRGGGSSLYGSNAIAGTINLILKEPDDDSYEFSLNSSLTGVGVDGSGNAAQDNSLNFNASMTSDDNRSGISLFGFYRNKDHFDANNDSFTEIPELTNKTLGSRFFHRIGNRGKLTVDYFGVYEKRRGGDKFNYPVHESGISEAIEHNINTVAITFDRYFQKLGFFSIYFSGQHVDRDSYYGAEQSLSDYGKTTDFTYTAGAQYNISFNYSHLVVGFENMGAWLKDKKLGYPDLDNAHFDEDSILVVPHTTDTMVADQTTNTIGAFTQFEINWDKFKFSLGGRYDRYNIEDKEHEGEKKPGNVFSPRINILYDINDHLQARVNYSQGYRSPQIFDEDLHIETSGARKVLHKNDPDLKQETSHSYMASIDFNKEFNNIFIGLLVEGFYTQLMDPFVNEFSKPDETGTVYYTRINAEKGASVKGANIEMNFIPIRSLALKSGFTLQTSKYEESQEFEEKRFFRTPEDYGYLTCDWKAFENFTISATGTYTGSMLIPYFGNQLAIPEAGELRKSDSFFDLGLKLRYNIKLNGTWMQLFAGVKNILNSYQDDFDRGIDRDPGYIYGPLNPRTVYIGIKVGNFLNKEFL